MPVTYVFQGSLLRLVPAGEYEVDDLIAAFRAAMADPACPPRCAFLVDVSRSTSLENRTPDQVRHLAGALKPYATRLGGRCAVIAVRDVHYGLSRMGAAFTAAFGVEATVFRDEPSALAWLGVSTAGGGLPSS
jgi:hypothetical protein